MSATLTTTANTLILKKGDLEIEVAKNAFVHRRTATGSTIQGNGVSMSLKYDETTADGQSFSSAQQLQDWISNNAFKTGGSGPGPEPGALKSLKEEGKGWPVDNYLPITQEDFDSLEARNPFTIYDIIEHYPA